MKRQNILLSVILIASSVFSVQGVAKADYVDDVINNTNRLTSDYTTYEREVLQPAIQQRVQYLQVLANLCYQGDATACYEYDAAFAAEYERLSNANDYMRTRQNPY